MLCVSFLPPCHHFSFQFATLAAAGKRFSKPGPVTIIVRRKRGSQKNVAYFDGNGKDTVDGIKSY